MSVVNTFDSVDQACDVHIAVNAHLLSSEASYRRAGVSRYVQEVLTGMWKLNGSTKWLVYHSISYDVASLPGSEQASLSPSSLPTSKPWARIVWEQCVAPRLLTRDQPHVLFCPLNVAPLLARCPTVLTIHDLAFLRFRMHRPEKRKYLATMTRMSAARASHIIAISKFTRDEIVELLGVPRRKITVVYNGCDHVTQKVSDSDARNFRQEKNLPDRFLLFVGTLEPRKNLASLFRAFALVHSRLQMPLVIVGGKGWKTSSIFKLVQELNLESSVRFEGFVNDDDLPRYYAAATATIYPSLYEGFGLPPLESMSQGTPVLTSNISSLPEVVGDAAILADPMDINALASSLIEIVENDRTRSNLREAGYRRIEQFKWKQTAIQTLKVLREVAGK